MPTGSWSGTRRSFPADIRRRILHRDNYRCTRCGHHDPSGTTLAADHIIPNAEGGTDTPTNGQTLCDFGPHQPSCHLTKTREEQRRGRERIPRRQRPTSQHPGIIG